MLTNLKIIGNKISRFMYTLIPPSETQLILTEKIKSWYDKAKSMKLKFTAFSFVKKNLTEYSDARRIFLPL